MNDQEQENRRLALKEATRILDCANEKMIVELAQSFFNFLEGGK